jgi:hypothetical protein
LAKATAELRWPKTTSVRALREVNMRKLVLVVALAMAIGVTVQLAAQGSTRKSNEWPAASRLPARALTDSESLRMNNMIDS